MHHFISMIFHRIGVLVCDTEDPEYPVWDGEEGGNSSTPFNSTNSTASSTSAAFGNTTWEELSERSYQIMRERQATDTNSDKRRWETIVYFPIKK